ncbi:hypothetical protein Pyrfu_0601 [Pyrolobus fumarii 1A]|uniref:Uncharacterized protein n=1 Tax=Pyrolobus fumarii (strain DSM 11204 / 1A) TaxID=694429 RepID=G0EH20_PYRF1|nr:hypothetical protein [Pyrolobus fumarii]AEM38470.1 hypothetical protein Pyrfu_0601 [Pyrolobus fumarii 1A]
MVSSGLRAAALLLLVAITVAAAAAVVYAAGPHGQQPSPGQGAAGKGRNVTAPVNVARGHPRNILVTQFLEPDSIKTGAVLTVRLVLNASLAEDEVVKVFEVLPPWVKVVDASDNVEVLKSNVTIPPVKLLAKVCVKHHVNCSILAGNATRAGGPRGGHAAGNATGLMLRTGYWGQAALYMPNATLIVATLSPDETTAEYRVTLAYAPPVHVLAVHGVAVKIVDDVVVGAAPVWGETRVRVLDAPNATVSVEGECVRVRVRALELLRVRTRLMLALLPNTTSLVVEAPDVNISRMPPVYVSLVALEDEHGRIRARVRLSLMLAAGQELNLTINAGAVSPHYITAEGVNVTTPPKGYRVMAAVKLEPRHQFRETVTLRLRLGHPIPPNAIVMYNDGTGWHPLPTRVIDAQNGVVEVNTTHFTIFAVVAPSEETETTTTETTTTTTTTTTVSTTTTTTTTTTTETTSTTSTKKTTVTESETEVEIESETETEMHTTTHASHTEIHTEVEKEIHTETHEEKHMESTTGTVGETEGITSAAEEGGIMNTAILAAVVAAVVAALVAVAIKRR